MNDYFLQQLLSSAYYLLRQRTFLSPIALNEVSSYIKLILPSSTTSVVMATSRTHSFEKLLESPFSQTGIHGVSHTQRERELQATAKPKKRKGLRSRRTLPKNGVRKTSKYNIVSSHSIRSLTTPTTQLTSGSNTLSDVIIDNHSSVSSSRKSLTRSILTPFQKPRLPSLRNNHSTVSGVDQSSTSCSDGRQFSLKLNPLQQSVTRSTIRIRLTHNGTSPKHSLSDSHSSSSTSTTRQRGFTRQKHTGDSRDGSDTSFTIEELAKGLIKMDYKKIVVMSGAGISTASGIPDFRTPGSGLYDNLKQYRIPEPTAIFDIMFFSRNPKPFFTLAKELYPGNYLPNPVHYFIRLLQDKGLLLRNYTQNIDGLERLAGVKPIKLIEAHGSFSNASCTRCHTKHDPEDVRVQICNDKIPRCKYKYCSGIVKPDIVFFGEDLPQRFYSQSHTDLAQCDLLFIMGTSLEVEPFAGLASLTRYNVPRILINREAVGPFKYQKRRSSDIMLIGDLLEQINELMKLTGWENDLKELIEGCTGKTDLIKTLNNESQTTPKDPSLTTSSTSKVAKDSVNDELTKQLNELKLTENNT